MSKRTKYPIHPDFKKWAKFNPPVNRFVIWLSQSFLPIIFKSQKYTNEVIVTQNSILTTDGKKIQSILYCPEDIIEELSAFLVYFHGGGFVFPAAPYHFRLAREYAIKAHCKVLFVNYRLAPKYPFPTATEDCYSAYSWVVNNADSLGIELSKIAVAGDSAGGGSHSSVCQSKRE